MAPSRSDSPEIELPHRIVAQAIIGGANAASCSVLEQSGVLDYHVRKGEEATASVSFRLPGDTEARVRVFPLTEVLMLAARYATIDEIAAPDQEGWTWTAAAYVMAERTLPAGLILPEPLRRRSLWSLVARDDRGLSAAIHSEDRSLSRHGRLGKVLAGQVAMTTVPGARGRVTQAQRRLDSDSFATVIAGTVADYFATPAASTGADGGQALLAYEISSYDPLARSWQTYASFPPEAVEPVKARRAALSDRSLRALELEVFGARHDARKSTARLVSLHAPTDDDVSNDAATIVDAVPGPDDTARTVEQRLELGELIARSSLSSGEREVVSLKAREHTEPEIAALLGLSRGAVTSHWTRARRKIAEAAKEKSEGV